MELRFHWKFGMWSYQQRLRFSCGKKGIILTKDNLAGGIRMEVRFLVIVANRKQSNIFFYCYYANFL
jgi:hypothetical protein